MTKSILGLILFFSILNIQCKKNDDKPAIDISQITATDEFGNILIQDNTDWKNDNNWTDEEKALFQTPTSNQLARTATGMVTIFPAYPNPATNQQFFLTKTSTITLLEIVITDNRLSVKKRFFVLTSDSTSSIAYLFDPAIFSNNSNYRIYYGFYSLADGLFYKGHGDIRISR